MEQDVPDDQPIRTTTFSKDELNEFRNLRSRYKAAGVDAELRLTIEPTHVNQVIIEGDVKAHVVDNADYSLSSACPYNNYHVNRVQFEDGSWFCCRLGDDEDPVFEAHGVSIWITGGCLTVRGRDEECIFSRAEVPSAAD
ncbi:hypothetical protein IVA94_36780 [Bradyrhizobium sp. 156]|uniref:hypothetical protein n=1 Tax=Bradyrhizobium sp. 156 TaxID=2782630 RepID=UPI001FF90E26|nr:hypothetical protein [Bradyrhizobium sp. 156]MCK1326324.1 hypothetical protein [Bradyrhizobium sp. 156]